MAKITCKMDFGEVNTLSKELQGIFKKAVYKGAGTVLQAMVEASADHDDTGGLTESWGVHKITCSNGEVYTSVSVDGYSKNADGTLVPNALKANALESGTSWSGQKHQKATHCFSKAAKSVMTQTVQSMEDVYEEEFNMIFK